MRRSRLITSILIPGLVIMTLGMLCGPVTASVQPMQHCSQEESHDGPMTCCMSHTADVGPGTVSLAPPQTTQLDLVLVPDDGGFDRAFAFRATFEWPPGASDLTTRLCTLLI